MEQRGKRRLSAPEIPKEAWSDFRQDYEAGMSVVQIAEKYYCDPRTVRTAIIYNRSSADAGKRIKPRAIEDYDEHIEVLWQRCGQEYSSLCARSRVITAAIQKEGFSGGERTVRNYLKNQPYVIPYLKEEGNDSII